MASAMPFGRGLSVGAKLISLLGHKFVAVLTNTERERDNAKISTHIHTNRYIHAKKPSFFQVQGQKQIFCTCFVAMPVRKLSPRLSRSKQPVANWHHALATPPTVIGSTCPPTLQVEEVVTDFWASSPFACRSHPELVNHANHRPNFDWTIAWTMGHVYCRKGPRLQAREREKKQSKHLTLLVGLRPMAAQENQQSTGHLCSTSPTAAIAPSFCERLQQT